LAAVAPPALWLSPPRNIEPAAFALAAIVFPTIAGLSIRTRQLPDVDGHRFDVKARFGEPRFGRRDDQWQMRPDEFTAVAFGHVPGLVEAKERANGFVRNAQGADFPLDPDVDERVRADRPY